MVVISDNWFLFEIEVFLLDFPAKYCMAKSFGCKGNRTLASNGDTELLGSALDHYTMVVAE
jgi:hypothetical protein